jgi:glutathione S-transferase
LIDLWENEIDCLTMQGKLNLAQIALVCALGIEVRNRDFRWREGHPRLRAWFERLAARPSIAATVPPEARCDFAR